MSCECAPLDILWLALLRGLSFLLEAPTLQIQVDGPAAVSGPNFWDRLWPLLLTAVLTLAVYWIVQLFLVPKSERKKRIEDRWERDARELGQLVVFGLQDVLGRMRTELWRERAIADVSVVSSDLNEKRQAALNECRAKQGELDTELRTLGEQMKWLVDRLSAHDPDSQKYRNLKAREFTSSILGLPAILGKYRTADDEVPSMEQVKAADEKSKDHVEKFTGIVTSLIDQGRGKSSSWRPKKVFTPD